LFRYLDLATGISEFFLSSSFDGLDLVAIS